METAYRKSIYEIYEMPKCGVSCMDDSAGLCHFDAAARAKAQAEAVIKAHIREAHGSA